MLLAIMDIRAHPISFSDRQRDAALKRKQILEHAFLLLLLLAVLHPEAEAAAAVSLGHPCKSS